MASRSLHCFERWFSMLPGNQTPLEYCRLTRMKKKTEFIFYYRFGCTSTILITMCDTNYEHDDTPQHVHHFERNFRCAKEQHAKRMCFKYTFFFALFYYCLILTLSKANWVYLCFYSYPWNTALLKLPLNQKRMEKIRSSMKPFTRYCHLIFHFIEQIFTESGMAGPFIWFELKFKLWHISCPVLSYS